MGQTDVRCDGELIERRADLATPGLECTHGTRCAAANVLRSYWASPDAGLAAEIREAHEQSG